MTDELAGLDTIIARLRGLAAHVQDDVAREAAPLISAIAKGTAAAGTDPYGEPWQLRKDGQRAIPDAAEAVDVVARGPVLVIRVKRGAAIQNYLSPERRRQVIPDPLRPLPAAMVGAVQEAASRVLRKAMA